MKNIQRSCATCAEFDRDPEPGENCCRSQVMFTVQAGVKRQPEATDVCHQHLTVAEDRTENSFIEDALHRGGAELATQVADAVCATRVALRRAELAW